MKGPAAKRAGVRFAAGLLCAPLLLLCACDAGVGVILGGAEKAKSAATLSSVVFLPMEKVRTLNPVLSKDEDSYFIGKLIYESLFETDDSLAAAPALAESYSYDESGLSLTIRLRSGLLWSDGERLDAADVVFSIDAYTADPDAHLFGENVRNIKSAKPVAGDPLALVIAFKEASDTSVALLRFPILPAHLYRSQSALKRDAENFIPVGSGPYLVQSFDRYSHLTLTGNPNHAGGPPENSLEFQVIPSRGDALNMLSINAISYTVAREGDRDTIYRDAEMRVKSFPGNEAVFTVSISARNCFRARNCGRPSRFAWTAGSCWRSASSAAASRPTASITPDFSGWGRARTPIPRTRTSLSPCCARRGFWTRTGTVFMNTFPFPRGKRKAFGVP
jgi:ABC-type transport system substrate-binding protein